LSSLFAGLLKAILTETQMMDKIPNLKMTNDKAQTCLCVSARTQVSNQAIWIFSFC